jgi:DNA-binding Xre family transcriptional regulator
MTKDSHAVAAARPEGAHKGPPLPVLRPRLRVVMAERGVRSVRALYRMLEPYDRAYELRLSLIQLHRLANGEAKQINVEGLCALCAVLNCRVSDLYEVESTPLKEAS